MADEDTSRSSLDGIKQMRAQGLARATPADAPEIELDEQFWRNARVVSTEAPRKTSVHLRIDPDARVLPRRRQSPFHAHGEGAEGLRTKSHRAPSEPAER